MYTQSKPLDVFSGCRKWNSEGTCVSIIVRTKDRPLLLPRCLQSITDQSYEDWHIYLINDGGRAGAVEDVVQCNAKLNGRLTVIHNEESLGMEAATNVGLALAGGSFLAILDDDDTWHPEFLSTMFSFLRDKSNIRFAAVACRTVVIREKIEGNLIIEESREDFPWHPTVDASDLFSRNTLTNNSVLLRMEAVHEVGSFNVAMPVLGDWDYWMRLLAVGDIGVIDRQLAHYHQRFHHQTGYGNTVIAGLNDHILYDTLYRNSLVRISLEMPQMRGVLHVMLRAMDEHSKAIANRMVQHDNAILRKIDEVQRIVNSHTTDSLVVVLRSLLERLDRVPPVPGLFDPASAQLHGEMKRSG